MITKELWDDLPIEVKNQFENQSQSLEKKRGESIYQQGDITRGLYFIQEGLVGLVLIDAQSGKEHLLRFFKKGDFFGHRALFSDEVYHGTTIALEPTKIKFIPKKIALSIIENNPILLKNIIKVLSKELRLCETHQVMILENQILGRTAQSIVYLKDLHPEHNWTRQEIANFCASTVSTIIKTLADLEEMGLIEQVGRTINVLDRDGLIALQEKDTI